MSVLVPTTTTTSTSFAARAYTDPVIFRDDRVLKTLLRKEAKYLPITRNYFSTVQTEIKQHMRKEVADWMLEVCEDRNCNPEVFCLAMNYLDRFLSVCRIGRSQLQLLGAVCLMVAWKVREHEPLPSIRLIEYSDYNLNLMDIMVSSASVHCGFVLPLVLVVKVPLPCLFNSIYVFSVCTAFRFNFVLTL
jgi:hypothetical protein